MNDALCTCGEDIIYHLDQDSIRRSHQAWITHPFLAAGTAQRCEKNIYLDGGHFLCPRPAFHSQEGVECGLLYGEYLWVDNSSG